MNKIELNLKAMGRTMKARREELGLRQADVAENTGLALISYQQIEAGTRQTGLDTFVSISKYLNVDPGTLLGADLCIELQKADSQYLELFHLSLDLKPDDFERVKDFINMLIQNREKYKDL